jgi:hypothetical protein
MERAPVGLIPRQEISDGDDDIQIMGEKRRKGRLTSDKAAKLMAARRRK